MKIIYRPRCTGRTTELINQSHDKWMYIVCADRHRVEWTAYFAKKLGIDIPYPLCMKELYKGCFYKKGIKGFLFDDCDTIIENLLLVLTEGVPIETIVLTEKNDNIQDEQGGLTIELHKF